MKRCILLCLLPLYLTIFAYSQDNIPDDEKRQYTIGLYNDYYTRYVWRGMINYDQYVFQPGLWLDYNNFELTLSANVNIEEADDVSNLNEIDAVLSYAYNFKSITIQPGIQYFYYPIDKENSTGEVFLNLQYSFGGFFVYSNNNLDAAKYKAAYYNETGFNFDIELSDKTSYSINIGLGW